MCYRPRALLFWRWESPQLTPGRPEPPDSQCPWNSPQLVTQHCGDPAEVGSTHTLSSPGTCLRSHSLIWLPSLPSLLNPLLVSPGIYFQINYLQLSLCFTVYFWENPAKMSNINRFFHSTNIYWIPNWGKKNTWRNTGNTILYKADMRLISWVSENNDNYQITTSAGFSHEYIV